MWEFVRLFLLGIFCGAILTILGEQAGRVYSRLQSKAALEEAIKQIEKAAEDDGCKVHRNSEDQLSIDCTSDDPEKINMIVFPGRLT